MKKFIKDLFVDNGVTVPVFTFTVKTPLVITNAAYVVDAGAGDFTPVVSYGSIGDYAVVSLSGAFNTGYYKNTNNNIIIASDTLKLLINTITSIHGIIINGS